MFLFTGMEGQFNKYKHSKVDSMGFDYDYSSLMHYGKVTFSRNGKPTIRALNNPYMSLGRGGGFSELDIKKMNALYDCKSKFLIKIRSTAVTYWVNFLRWWTFLRSFFYDHASSSSWNKLVIPYEIQSEDTIHFGSMQPWEGGGGVGGRDYDFLRQRCGNSIHPIIGQSNVF